MKTALSPFLLAPIMAALLLTNAQAITLGEPQLKSYIGQRFNADIPYRLNSDERILDGCYQITPSANGISYLGSATVQVVPNGDGNSGVIRILARQVAEEPMLSFALKIDCESLSLTRDFTVFLDPAPVIDVPQIPVVKPLVTTKNTTPSAASRKLTALNQAESLQQIATKYYPSNPADRQRYLDRLKKSNPQIAEDDILPAGTEISIPGRRKTVAAPTKAVPENSAANDQGRLRLDGEERRLAQGDQATNPAAYVKELESKVLELSVLRQKLQLEIDALDQKLAQAHQGTPAASGPAVVAVAIPVPVPVPVVKVASAAQVLPAIADSKPARSVEQSSNWQWPGLGLIALVGGGVWWWQRRRQTGSLDLSDTLLSNLKTNYYPQRDFSQMSNMNNMNLGFEVEAEDGDNPGLDQVQYFLAQGETERAIDMLQLLLQDDPLDTERWLMLFRVYRQQGMKSDYIQLAHRFKAQNPPPNEDDWELVRSIGFKLVPDCELFIREHEEAPASASPHVATPIDLALTTLAQSAPNAPEANLAASAESALASSEIAQPNDVSLISLLQPTPSAAQPHIVASPLPIDDANVDLPDLTEKNEDEPGLSSLEQLSLIEPELPFERQKKSG